MWCEGLANLLTPRGTTVSASLPPPPLFACKYRRERRCRPRKEGQEELESSWAGVYDSTLYT
eukprot:762595-Hanusia_phi.AAC.1